MNHISYSHNQTKLDRYYQYFLLRQLSEGVDSEFAPENKKEQTDFYDLISQKRNFKVGWLIDHHKFHGASIIYKKY